MELANTAAEYDPKLSHQRIQELKAEHAALRLLASDNAALVLSFFARIFVHEGRRAVPWSELEARLTDELMVLRRQLGEGHYPGTAGRYLNDWAAPERGWLRRYLPDSGDEPLTDISPATEMLIEWLESFQQNAFIGTESRLLSLLEMLRELVQGSELDGERKLAALERERARIDEQIAQVKAGQLDTMNPRQVRERLFQVDDQARKLLRDFRQIEDNFRGLDRSTREQIAGASAQRGLVLDEIFAAHDAIRESDQGKSFLAFWELLLRPGSKRELLELLDQAVVLGRENPGNLDGLMNRLQAAGGAVNKTLARLNEQLRRFLDDRRLDENRRIGELIQQSWQFAVRLNQAPPQAPDFMHLSGIKANIDGTSSRPLYSPPAQVDLNTDVLEVGNTDIALHKLFEQVHVDEKRLLNSLSDVLSSKKQVNLLELLAVAPLQQGLAELVAWLRLAHVDERGLVDDQAHDDIALGEGRSARMPRIVFSR